MTKWIQKRIGAFRDKQRQVAAARRKRKEAPDPAFEELEQAIRRLDALMDAQAQWVFQRRRVELAQRADMQDRALERARTVQQQMIDQANLQQWWNAAWQQQNVAAQQMAMGQMRIHEGGLNQLLYGEEDMARKERDFAERFADQCVTVYRDDNGKLHNDEGPAVVLKDGSERYFWRGHEIPAVAFLDRDTMKWCEFAYAVVSTQATIMDMIECFGYERYADMAPKERWARWKTTVLDHGASDHPILGLRGAMLRSVEDLQYRSCNLMFVSMTDSSPQPDGTYKRYHKRVHPELRPILGGKRYGEPQALTVQNAVASLFGLRGEDYHPDVET